MNTKINTILDRLASSGIMFLSFTLVFMFWFFATNQLNMTLFISNLFYLPFGVIVLSYVFFKRHVFITLLIAHGSCYQFLDYINLSNNFSSISLNVDNIMLIMLFCISTPITIFLLKINNIEIGTNYNAKLNKFNIKHIYLLILLSSLVFGFLLLLLNLLHEISNYNFYYVIGNILGSIILIEALKLIINLGSIIKKKY